MHQPTHLDALPDFATRHIGPSEADQRRMLDVVGHPSLEALVDAALPVGPARAARCGCRPRPPSQRSSPSCGPWPGATRCCAR